MRRSLLALLPLAAVVALAGCGSGGGSTTVIVHDTTPEKTVTVNPGGPMKTATTTDAPNGKRPQVQRVTKVVHEESFRSPSGNIGCVIGSGLARCDLKDKEWQTLRPNDCPKEMGFGQGIQVGQSGPAGPTCAGDTTLNPTAPVLDYGTASQVDGFRCVSSEKGITCKSLDTKHGFFVSRQTFTTS